MSHLDPADRDRLLSLARERGLDPDALLREVAEFRVALDADLVIAAAAVDAGRSDIAAGAVGAACTELDGWRGRLAGLSRQPTVRRRVSLAVPSVALLGFGASLALAGGAWAPAAEPQHLGPATGEHTLYETADAHLTAFTRATDLGDADQVVAAAASLHASLSDLVTAAQAGDRVAGRRAAQLLLQEQLVIDGAPAHLRVELSAVERRLASRLQTSMGASLPVIAGWAATVTAITPAHPTAPRVSVRALRTPSATPLAPDQPAAPAAGTPSAAPTPSGASTAAAGTSASPGPSPSPEPSRSPLLPGGPSTGIDEGSHG